MAEYEVVTPAPARKLIDALAGKRAAYQRVYEHLGRDPCARELGAYRLSGPLEPIVCGVHLDRGFRLAFTMQPPVGSGRSAGVAILYVGEREPRHRDRDIWTILHDLFVERGRERLTGVDEFIVVGRTGLTIGRRDVGVWLSRMPQERCCPAGGLETCGGQEQPAATSGQGS